MYLGWFDDDRKKDPRVKIEEAMERYSVKFGHAPEVCLVNAADAVPFEGVRVKVVPYVRPYHFWIGREDASPPAAPEAA